MESGDILQVCEGIGYRWVWEYFTGELGNRLLMGSGVICYECVRG